MYLRAKSLIVNVLVAILPLVDPMDSDLMHWENKFKVINGHYRIQNIFKAGANVGIPGMFKETPLHDASRNGHYKVRFKQKIFISLGQIPFNKILSTHQNI